MKKIHFLLLSFTSLFSNETNYLNNLSVDVRAVYVNYNYDKGFPDADAFATSLKIKYEQEILKGLTGGIAFGTVQDLGIKDYDKLEKKRNMAYLFDKDKNNFSILHQAFLKYTYSKSLIELGRFELETPLISSDDYFALSNSFQGIHADIKEIENYNFRLGFISQMSGAWDSAYDGATFNSMTKQAWAHRADTGSETYYNLVDDLGVDNAGMGYLGVEYEKDKLKLQLYDHIMLDAYNSIFTQIDYTSSISGKELLLAAQYIKYDAIGALKNNSNPDAVVDYATYSAKAQIASDNYKVKLAYTGITDTPSIHFFGTAGGYPEFAYGMMVTYFSTSLRDANIYSLTPSFDFTNGENAYNLTLLYAYYDLNSDYTKGGYIGESINGDGFMHAYGVSGNYTYNKRLSWTMKLGQRVLEHGDQNLLFRTILGYTF
ncbi:MAG: outer membrane porin, OprD family [Helicobacteraceae bacterium]|nr:outer membrane porin, OprD family [Helicobacteraceae bacterium]